MLPGTPPVTVIESPLMSSAAAAGSDGAGAAAGCGVEGFDGSTRIVLPIVPSSSFGIEAPGGAVMSSWAGSGAANASVKASAKAAPATADVA